MLVNAEVIQLTEAQGHGVEGVRGKGREDWTRGQVLVFVEDCHRIGFLDCGGHKRCQYGTR
jgi:hypothetical protein